MNGNALTTKNKIGLALAGVLGLAEIPSVAIQTPDGDVGPPVAILALGTVCGIVTVAAVILAWVQVNKGAVRIAAGAQIVAMLGTLPTFFVDTPAGVKILVAVLVLATFASLILMLSPERHSAPVVD